MGNLTEYITNCGGFGLVWEVKINDFTAQKNRGYFIDTSNNPITITLPTNAEIGDGFYIVDSVGAVSESNRVVINSNGHNIMGLSDDLSITERYMNVFLVYADATKGWVIADGKGCNQDSTAGTITVPTTIYLAPSATSQSPTGVVGSDLTGDGSQDKPFFSIKRAMEYLENYSIKPGVYVTIRGLPGKYYYNDDHAVDIRHKDAKYIRVDFDMLDSGNYHETIVTTDPVTVTNNSDHDLIEFTVNDIGSGFYQIQAGDYIKIRPDNSILNDPAYAVWSGFYRVYSVDVPNNKVTMVFKRDQVSGSYSSHQYGLPSTISSGVVINVIKLSTHIYVNISDVTSLAHNSFFYSEFGFGGIKLNASNEKYYETGGTTGVYNNSFLSIYDGIINDVIFHVNGFSTGVYFDNLKCYFYDANDKLYSMVTSCGTGLSCDNSTLNMIGFSGNNCHYPFDCNKSIIHNKDSASKSVLCNSYYHGISIRNTSYYTYTSSDASVVDVLNIFYNSIGIICWIGDELVVQGANIAYNNIGIDLSGSSTCQFFLNYSDNISFSKIYNNTSVGIKISSSSSLLLYYINIYNNGTGVRISSGSNVKTDTGSSSLQYKYNIYNNSSYGLYISDSTILTDKGHIYNNSDDGINLSKSTSTIYNLNIEYNSGDGIVASNSNISLSDCNINNNQNGINIDNGSVLNMLNSNSNYNSNIGVNLRNGSYAQFGNCNINNNTSHGLVPSSCFVNVNDSNIQNNGGYGIYASYSAKVQIYNHTGYEISGNTTYDIVCSYNTSCDMFNHVAVPYTSPAKNTAPSYSSAYYGSYILEVLI